MHVLEMKTPDMVLKLIPYNSTKRSQSYTAESAVRIVSVRIKHRYYVP